MDEELDSEFIYGKLSSIPWLFLMVPILVDFDRLAKTYLRIQPKCAWCKHQCFYTQSPEICLFHQT